MNLLRRLTDSPRPLLWLGVLVFVYSWFASLVLQLWLIPTLFTQPGAAEGLVVLDSIGFDRKAKMLAEVINTLGWSAWELRPGGQSTVGILAALYALFGPTPTVILPFNAAVHAMSACVVLMVLRNFFTLMPAMLGALFFALNPSSFEWVAQVHRDGIFILGNLLFILGILRFVRGFETRHGIDLWHWLIWLLLTLVGSSLIWVSRPYWIHITFFILILTVVTVMLWMCFQGKIASRNLVRFAVMILLLGLFHIWLTVFHSNFNVGSHLPEVTANLGTNTNTNTNMNTNTNTNTNTNWYWRHSKWLPERVEIGFYRIATMRLGAISQGGNSLVDGDWHLDSVGAIFGYVPRALQVGFFSPFPNLWAGEGSTPAMTMARKLLGGFTLSCYLCLVGFAIGLWRMRQKLLLWVMVGICSTGILIYAITYPNVGSLIRYRYGFYMVLISFGIASLIDLWPRCGNRLKRNK